jgi:hypothetical protein
MKLNLVRIGATALKIYTMHILVFTIGCVAGAVEALFILCAIWGPCR